MKENVIALIDCDSFFVSCEQSADKSLQGKAVCVLGNNDGCVLARSKEAKKMGIKMGEPYFMAKKHSPDCIYLSGNYKLYSDFSRKVMAILRDFSPTVQVYSVDEAFVDFSGLKKLYKTDYLGIAKMIRARIKEELDINVSVGVSKSKVLAKLACEKAKNLNSSGTESGIFLIGQRKIPKILKETKVGEIWGIGRNTALLFNRWGVLNCLELSEKSDQWLKDKIGKRGVEIRHELLGECLDKVKTTRKLPQSIQTTRSFPKFSKDLDYIKNALNIHIHESCVRLRKYNGKCKTVGVMLRTKDFQVYYTKKNLENSSNFEIEISRTAMKLLKEIFISDISYRSCGVTLDGLEFIEDSQLSLFTSKKKDYDKLAKAIDKLEARFGENIIRTGFNSEDNYSSSELPAFKPTM